MNGQFEWDPQKALTNYEKHGISFEAARFVFRDPFALEFEDDRFAYDEDRWIIIGDVQSRLITVAYTLRGGVIRLISARGAEPYERRIYSDRRRW